MDATTAPAGQRIVGLIGVYDAVGTLRGEVAYWVGARLGRRHCALCDITHGLARERADWRSCRAGLPVPFTTFHLDDQPDEVRAAAGGVAPVVLATTEAAHMVLLGPDELAACEGSPEGLVEAIERAAADRSLVWSAP